MQITLYKNFSKRKNSTKQPTGGTTAEVYLKENTSIENPTFLIDGIDTEVNYISAFGNYYYVSDITLGNKNIYEISCTKDVLATHKSAIGSLNAYVEYSATQKNKWIPDRRLTMSVDAHYINGQTDPIFGLGSCYVIAVAGRDVTGLCQVGLVCYYAINAPNLQVLTDALYSDSFIDDLKKFFNDPFQCLIEAHWIPFDIGTYTNFIYLGSNMSNAQGHGLKEFAGTSTGIYYREFDIPWQYNDWRDFSPYTILRVWLPFYGMVDIDTSLLINGEHQTTKIGIRCSLDPIAGEVCYGINAGGIIQTYRADCSVPLSVGQTTGSKVAAVGEILGGVVATGAGVIGLAESAGSSASVVAKGVASVAGGIASIGLGAATMFQENSSAKGGTGGFGQANLVQNFSAFGQISWHYYYHEFATEPGNINSIEGSPLFTTRTISSLSGYIKCAGASVSLAGKASDTEEVNTYLNTGFYYE